MNTIFTINTVKAVVGGMEIDADGSPRAYGPGGLGLDYIGNAGRPGNWFGIATTGGIPFVQQESDPAPGYYVSTTALENQKFAISDPRRYVNSELIPFVVIPSKPKFGIVLGDVGIAFNLNNGESTSFVVGDIGPANKLGEASIKAASNLKINSNAKNGGTPDQVILYVFFINSEIEFPELESDIISAANQHFEAFGGMDALKRGLPHLNWPTMIAPPVITAPQVGNSGFGALMTGGSSSNTFSGSAAQYKAF